VVGTLNVSEGPDVVDQIAGSQIAGATTPSVAMGPCKKSSCKMQMLTNMP